MKIYQQIMPKAKLLLLLVFCSLGSMAFAVTKDQFDDWITTDTCSKTANILCHGYYKQYPFLANQNDNVDEPIAVTSDEANFVAKGTSVFMGNVVATQGNKVIKSNRAEVFNDETGQLKKITVLGDVRLLQPGVRVDGTRATAYIEDNRNVVDDAVYRLYERHVRGECKRVTVFGSDVMLLDNATYTTCAPSSNAWYLQASETKLNRENGQGEAWHAKMYLRGVPVFYWPYVNFPIDKRRMTGFLQPEYEDSSLNGNTAILPFYWNIAPNYDATITTNYMTLRSWKFDTIFRYLTTTSNGVINFDFLPHDRAYQALRNQLQENPNFQQSSINSVVLSRNAIRNSDFRYRFAIKHETKFTKQLLFNINYTATSDSNYLYDFSNYSSNYATDRFSTLFALQRAGLQYFSQVGSLGLVFERYKTYHPVNVPAAAEQLSKLPQLTYNSLIWNPYYNFQFSVGASYTQFKSQLIPDNANPLSYGNRLHMRPVLSYPIMNPGWFIVPRVQVNYVHYSDLYIVPNDLASGVSPNNSSLTLPLYDIKTGLIFDRNISIFKNNVIQTLEPTVYYLYVPSENQNDLPNFDSGVMTFDYNQVFRDNRYSGSDLISEANQVSMGIASKFFSEVTGEELGMLAIGRIYYFHDTPVRLTENIYSPEQRWSPYAMVGKLKLNEHYYLEGNWVRSSTQTNTASFVLQYKRTPVQVMNFSYQYIIDPEPNAQTGNGNSNLHQLGASAAWQVAPSWRILGKFNYDVLYHRSLETIAGFEFHTCCTALRFVWSRNWMADVYNQRQYNHRFRLQFIFKGFAGIGNAEDRYIASVIPGYQAGYSL